MAAAPANPVYVQLGYGWAMMTPAALRTLGIAADSDVPAGARLDRDAAGKRTVGYFDNSGTEMAKTIADALRRAASSTGWHERYDVKLIVLSGASPGSHEAALRFSELSAPVRTFLSVRERRSALAEGRAEDETCAMPIMIVLAKLDRRQPSGRS